MPLEQKTWDDPQGPVLVLAGALDVRCTAELRDVLYALIARADGAPVVVDIAAVYSVDMTVLKLLAVANRTAERQGGRVVLRGASIGVRRLLHLTHLRPMVRVEPPSTSRAV
jgi:anti-anti-sigma factor